MTPDDLLEENQDMMEGWGHCDTVTKCHTGSLAGWDLFVENFPQMCLADPDVPVTAGCAVVRFVGPGCSNHYCTIMVTV